MSVVFPDTLPAARYRFDFEVTVPLRLPEYAGSMIRGVFGRALRRLACMTREKDCKACPLYRSCAYTSIFETPAPVTHELQKFSQIPNPYIIEPPEWGERLYGIGKTLSFHMVLIGRTRDQLPMIIYALKRGLAYDIGHGKAALRRVLIAHENEEDYTMIYEDGDQEVEPHENTIHIPRETSESSMRLQFLTPLRLQHNGRALPPDAITAPILLSALIRRLNLLMEFHAGIQLTDDFAAAFELTQQVSLTHQWHWKDWQRFSSRQKQAMKLGGAVGFCTLEHLPPEIVPFLIAGQWLHLGKNATLGLGHYRRVG